MLKAELTVTSGIEFDVLVINALTIVGGLADFCADALGNSSVKDMNKVLRIFFKILVIWANFGDFGEFDSIDFQILEKSL